MLPRQGEMGENTPLTRTCTLEPSKTFERVTTIKNMLVYIHVFLKTRHFLSAISSSVQFKRLFIVNPHIKKTCNGQTFQSHCYNALRA